jgi:hypothetical protein
MKEFKRFVAGLTILGVMIISVIVAFRLAPETWAVMAGIIFGVVAALPMCAIVVLLLRQRPVAPPAPPAPPPPPQIIMLHPGATLDPHYAGSAGTAPRMLRPAPQAYAPAAPAYEEWLDAELEGEADPWSPPAYAPPRRTAAAPVGKPTYRILGD